MSFPCHPLLCASALLCLSVPAASAVELPQAETPCAQESITELSGLAAPSRRGGTLRREIHEWSDGGYSQENRLYAVKGEQKVLLHQSPRPVRFLAAEGPFWVLWDTKLARTGSMVFVIHVPEGGTPFVMYLSQPPESSGCMNDELLACHYADGLLHLKLRSTELDTGLRYGRRISLGIDAP